MAHRLERIVVGVDESEGAAVALRWAIGEGCLHRAEVMAVMAWGFLDQHHTVVAEQPRTAHLVPSWWCRRRPEAGNL